MLEEKYKLNLLRKISAVRELGSVIAKYQSNLDRVDYEVYLTEDGDLWNEWVIIRYNGFGYSVRNCTGNSFSAIVEEIATKLESGYYSEQRVYQEDAQNPKLHKLGKEVF